MRQAKSGTQERRTDKNICPGKGVFSPSYVMNQSVPWTEEHVLPQKETHMPRLAWTMNENH
jgi:hypothetical protein